ncbi:MAG TPA: serine/threonine-protein kinase, partial [Pseudomonadota bacterium]|nr:serine/threonine-protein kinase [Pseudomonadota bacterium]
MSLIGKRLGNYDIQGKLGEGGMGIVYMGVHPQIGKKVAVKVLHPELSDKADVVTRFFNEAKAVNDINHPNIVDIIDFGEATVDGTTFKYIMMEFLDGESLSARMRREGVTIRESVSILAQCCSALAASHAKGVVHRDIKPWNFPLLNLPKFLRG